MNKNLKQGYSLMGMLICIILILLLIGGIVGLNNKNSRTIDSVNFEMLQQNFLQTIALIKSQWLLDGRPASLQYKFYDQDQNVTNETVFHMNRLGWPVLMDRQTVDYCKVLLRNVTNTLSNDEVNQAFKITNLQKEGDIRCQFCDAGDNGKCFNYSTRTTINKENK